MPKNKHVSLLSPQLSKYFQDYSSYHRTPGNKLTHYFGITFIGVSLLGLLGNLPIHLPSFTEYSPYIRLDGGTLLLGLGVLWYLWMDWKIAIPFAFVLTGVYFLGRALPTPVNWTLFIVGWILQGVGHYVFEKKSPAFFKNLTHVLIGPLWIFARCVGYK